MINGQKTLKLVLPDQRPTSAAEYLARTHANSKIAGLGLATTMHVPCPFCAAPDFFVCFVVSMEKHTEQGATCKECGRGCRAIYTRGPGSVQFEFVQTGGDDPPDWLTPKMRRVDRDPA